MIGIFYDVLNYEKFYYVAEEVEIKKGIRKFTRLSGIHKDRKEAEKLLKLILKDMKKQPKSDGQTEVK